MTTDKIYKCDNRFVNDHEDPAEIAYFIPIGVGSVSPAQNSVTFNDGLCFQSITFTYSQTGDDNDIGDVTITVDTEKPKSLFCKDWFLFGSADFYHVETFFFRGKHQVTFKNLTPDAKADLKANGVRVFMFCDGYIDTFISAFKTLLAFLGGIGTNPYLPIIGSHVPEYMEKANLEFLN